MNITTTSTFIKNITAINNGYRYIINQGSTRSGKSFSAMQINVLRRLTLPKTRGVTVGITLDIIKSTAIRDLQIILGELYESVGKFYRAESTYRFKNGSEIKFISADKPEKYRGLDSYDVFLEEPNIYKEPDELVTQLAMRASGFVMLTLNPSRRLKWLNDIESREDSILLHSTYRDNQFLNGKIIKEIETRSATDEIYKAIYSDGVYVVNTKQSIFTNWTVTDFFPPKEVCKWTVFGLDFGWSNDPSALIELRYYDSGIYLKEHLYETGLTTSEIYDKIKDIEEYIICDNSEPRLVTELKSLGAKVKKVRKPLGSKLTNIKQLQNIPIYLHSKSLNLRTEIELYQWKKISGEIVNQPNEKEDHLMDALFYAWRSKVRT